jgi:hypothetical protein
VRRSVSAALMILAAVAVLAACGLEIVPDLDPPGIPTPAGELTPVFHVIYEVTAIPEFRGFEVYYKFYSSDQLLQDGLSAIGELEAAGFHRMCSPGTLSEQGLPYVPLIPVNTADRSAGFSTDLIFNLVLSPYMNYQASSPPPYTGLRRSTTELLETKTFDKNALIRTDIDLVDVNWVQVDSDGRLYLVAYAISYGLYDLNQSLYSSARYLGYMVYNF